MAILLNVTETPSRVLFLTRTVLLAAAMLLHAQYADALEPCPEINMQDLLGKRDYYSGLFKKDIDDVRTLRRVEWAHFNSDVRNLVRGQSVAHPGGDLNFILNHFPNHIPALEAFVRLSFREGRPKVTNVDRPVHCILERAIAFKPDDPTTRTLYGVFLARMGDPNKAIEQLEIAERSKPDDPNVVYNLGLLYFDKRDFERSREYAKRAYAGGFPLPGLKDKLKKAGEWAGD